MVTTAREFGRPGLWGVQVKVGSMARGLLRSTPVWDDRPVRAELFSVERLEEHARSLAIEQKVSSRPVRRPPLARRLAENDAMLLAAYRDVAAALEEGAAITPAAEWLVDNYHVVERQIREIRADLPPGYYRELPKLAVEPFAGYPRVFGLAWAYVAHTDSLFEPETLRRFVRAYQQVQPLTIGELWAVAITLRIVLIENLRRIAERVMISRRARQEADAFADRLLGAAGRKAKPLEEALADLPRGTPPDAFLVQLVHRLRDQEPDIAPALAWLDDRLARQGTTADDVVQGEHQRQVTSSVTVRNIITSMRLISDVDWTELFERFSLVDDVLGQGARFADMDFPTRNLYRTAIEELARGSGLAELEIAHRAVERAGGAREGGAATDDRLADPGYYLIAGGRAELEAAIDFVPPLRAWPGRLYRALGIGGYVGAGMVLAALLLAAPFLILVRMGVDRTWLWVLAALGVVPAVDLAVALVNHVVTRGFRATLLPALELKDAVPAEWRTLVVVPTLLTSAAAIEEQIERLEIHHLASPQGSLYFALLSDWTDADAERAEGDESLLELARDGIDRLNRRHDAGPEGPRFLLLHRRRSWCESEGKWIGWERKRGKLGELNRLLRGATDTGFIDPPPVPPDVRYVITLDADTRLPRDTVRRLIGKMVHPLNRPRFEARSGRVVEGYAVLQPRVTPSLPVGREGSLFLKVFSSASGIDPYSAAVSDVYQDLFGEGSYAGKGIYDVDAFEAALAGRVPESALLSHDLFEGVFARAGLASDVEVVEDFPARYDTASLRHHRWARGDWQLLPWIVGRGPGRPLPGARGGVPAIGRWKMLDNLRRTLSAPSIVLALIAGWAGPLDASAVWTAFILATIALPPFLPVLAVAGRPRPGVLLRSHLRALAAEARMALVQWALMIVFLAHQAGLMADAIGRTLVRMFITRRRLLEWVPAAQAAFGFDPGLGAYYRRMAAAPAIGLAAALIAWTRGEGTWPLALGFAAAWIASPAVARWASLSPRAAGRRPVAADDAKALRLIARRTWRFFETFVSPADNALPPDNFQEVPEPVLARRTSPTNMGLYLLSVASARDFGWIGSLDAAGRLEATLSTMGRLARCRGHFLNWYDTQDLRPLDPQYVSSVDSGNLAGHLIALANACREWRETPIDDRLRFSGLADALELACEEAEGLRGARPREPAILRQVAADLAAFTLAVRQAALDGGALAERLTSLSVQVEILTDTARALVIAEDDGSDLLYWAEAVREAIESHRRDLDPSAAAALQGRLQALEQTARSMALAMDFAFLMDADRHLLSIGYRAVDGVLDPSCYDLLASEARLASFIAIAKGDAPARHWFRLGHAVAALPHGAALISWSGSMFEYLMPSLVMRAPAQSLLEQTNRLVVRRQIEYGTSLHIPWGVSEAAYNARDLEFTYQYSNFGVPGLGLKRGLADNMVVAPYATALASMVDPADAARNFGRLAAMGALGRYGFYEALDFTAGRVPDGQDLALVRCFMAHHQGMTIVAIANALQDGLMRRRFHAEPIVKATELLLQERTPRDVTATPPPVAETKTLASARRLAGAGGWRTADPHGATPATQLLSNGRYTVMLTAAGSGFSAWRDMAITRWREDATCDDWGSYVFLRDAATGEVWSAGLQPLGVEPDSWEVVFNEDRAEICRHDGGITTTLEVVVSAEDDAEVRRLTIANGKDRTREIEVTSYAELVLGPQSADAAHPAFSKLFVETEHLAGLGALVASRRRRDPAEPEIFAAHLAVVDGELVGKREFETDRARFLGRGGSVRAPAAVLGGRPLSGSTGAVLDPIFALRRRMRIAPGGTARIDFWTMAASSREEVLSLIDKHHDVGAFERAAALAWTQAQVQLHHLGIDNSEAGQYQRLAGHLVYASAALRPPSETIVSGAGAQSGLWSLGVSGDLPIILLRIAEPHELGVARQALQALEYWRSKRLAVDLVILNERGASYVQDLQASLETLVRASQSRPRMGEDRPAGSIFMLRADLITPEARALLIAAARVVLVGERGSLVDQLDRAIEPAPAPRPAVKRIGAPSELQPPRSAPDIEFFNGLGGFADQGREYVTVLGPGQSTPAPWINVIANPGFGFQASAEGGGYAWSGNAREFQLTPWSNDPTTDRPGQTLYVKDEDTGRLMTPTALPIRDDAATYSARHGWGYSRFEHQCADLAFDLVEYVPINDPVRISRLTIRNLSGRARRLSVTGYAEWVLGASRAAAAPFVVTSIDPATGAMFASNPWSNGFQGRVAFADLGGRQTSWTGDRREFLGRHGALGSPAALTDSEPLSRRVGAGLDPCAALRTEFEIRPWGRTEIVFLLGDAENEDAAGALVARYREANLNAVLDEVKTHWRDLVETVQVKTPDRSMDVMLNGWLLYQTLACRIWGRSGFYQASGAYGFRDQLQDHMALAAVRPALTREHLIRAAGRQFPEGDVQHWWLPLSGQGVRTRISDDRIWLPYAAAQYIEVSGDASVLDEPVSFLAGLPLEPEEGERFFQAGPSEEIATLYEHCARALDASLAIGAHGAPLIGSGDWNDGMNRVGERGLGESVWLGWFVHAAIAAFAPLAEARGDAERAAAWRAHAGLLLEALEREAWDGDWYKRGWFDDGEPLGSAASEECRIDSIAQSWAVISGAAEPARAARAMAAVERDLIVPQDGLALLFTPPFDRTPLDPGYIKGYPPGIRENGGQYTHAALWSVIAFAQLGEGDKAAALFWVLNPVNHARTRTDMHRYKVEPYVVAADVYAAASHVGRGGWTWYTGSAAWMQRAGIEAILGLRVRGGRLTVDPCIPKGWPGFEIWLRRGEARYHVVVENPDGVSRGVASARLDGASIGERPVDIALVSTGEHRLEIRLGETGRPRRRRTGGT